MEKYLISIIMPTFNRGYIIKDAIQSVLEQTISNWELIIVDDGSTDNTKDIIESFNNSRIVYLRNNKNRGANYCRNRGCLIAKGSFLAFLDSDNIWRKDKLEKQLAALQNSEDNVAFVFCRVEIINEIKRIIPDISFEINQLEKILKSKNIIDTSTVLMKKDIFNIVGGFDNDMPRIQDWDIFFRIIVVYHYKAIYLSEVLDWNVVKSDSISKDDNKFCVAITRFLEKYYKYLELNEIVCHMSNFLKRTKSKTEGMYFIKKFIESKNINTTDIYTVFAEQVYDYFKYYDILLLWKRTMEMNAERTIFSSDFKWRNSVIALYGLGVWGDLIYREAKNCGVRIKYGIDKKVEEFHDLEVVDIKQIPKSVNLIIVSIFQEYGKICEQLTQYYEGEILSIEDLIKGVEA